MGNLTRLSVMHRYRTGEWPSRATDFDEEDFEISEVPKDDSELARWDQFWEMKPGGDSLLLVPRDDSGNTMRLVERDGSFVWIIEPKSAKTPAGCHGG